MSRPTPPTYKTRNWPAYNKALKRRGSLTVWFDPEMSWDAVPTGRRGRRQTYSETAIQTCLTMKVLFGMALRQRLMARDFDRQVAEVQICIAVMNGYTALGILITEAVG